MCFHGNYKVVQVINPDQNNYEVYVDACIASEVQLLNDQGIITLGSCCGHGKAGQIVEWENAFGKWRCYASPPTALIKKDSVQLARSLGYTPFPYYYSEGISHGIWQLPLHTGCVTEKECIEWKQKNQCL